jgi:hypothetical protein
MCRTAQWRLTQTESKRRPVPGAFFRLPVRWVMQRGPDGLLACEFRSIVITDSV